MRALLLVAILSLAACVQREGPSRPEGGDSACARNATHSVTWSNQTDADTISAHSEGPSCAQAVITFVIRNASGDPLWTFASTYYDLHTGGVPPPGITPPVVTVEEMQKFLDGTVNVTQMRSGQMPDWAEGAAGPADATRPLHYNTAYPRETYEALRASDRPLLCYAAAADATQCLIIDPASNSPAVIIAFGP